MGMTHEKVTLVKLHEVTSTDWTGWNSDLLTKPRSALCTGGVGADGVMLEGEPGGDRRPQRAGQA